MGKAFHYNRAFLPEYLSTVVISLIVTWLTSGVSGVARQMGERNPHFAPSLVLYGALATALLVLTAYHRRRHSAVRVTVEGIERRFLGRRVLFVGWAEAAEVVERWGRFFGRGCRTLEVVLYGRAPIAISDFIHGYKSLRRQLEEAWGKPIRNKDLLSEDIARFESAATQRAEAFERRSTAPGHVAVLNVRVGALLPVFVVDVAVSMALIHGVFMLPGPHAFDPRVVYASSIALLCAALTARWVYYYLFSSAFLYKDIGPVAILKRLLSRRHQEENR